MSQAPPGPGPDLPAVLGAWLGAVSLPPPGLRINYRETAWSYRQPNSYLLTDAGERPVGAVQALDRGAALLQVGEVTVARLGVDARGGTSVSDPSGGLVGAFAPRWGVTAWRASVRVGGQELAGLEQRVVRPGLAVLALHSGVVVAWVEREAGRRFAGASRSTLVLGPAVGALPPTLVLCTVPALDEQRKAERRRRRQ